MTNTASSEKALAETINEIISAFKGVSHKGGVLLHETRVIDGYSSDAERAKARTKEMMPIGKMCQTALSKRLT